MSNLYIKHNIYSSEDIQRHYENIKGSNGHWFSKDTMAFFKSKIDGQVFADESFGLFYFVSSEKGSDMKRKYTIRSYNPLDAEIDTVGEFNYYSTLSHAKGRIEKILKNKP